MELTKIGKYEILGRLGVGSMGVVYKARDPEIDRTVAIKTIKGLDGDPELLERFRIEARSAGNLRHSNIITIFEVNTNAAEPYMVMDYVDGVSLESVLDAIGKLDTNMALHYAHQIAAALDSVHKKNIIHKDIKPANIMISNDHDAYILDFGVASINAAWLKANPDSDPEPVMGTPGYMSPEQILNEDLDFRTDLFSFAILLFEMLTGARPFKGKNYREVFQNIVKEPPQSIVNYGNFPLALEEVFFRALAKNKYERYPSAADFLKAVKAAVQVNEISRPDKPLRAISTAIRRQTKEFNLDKERAAIADKNKNALNAAVRELSDTKPAKDLHKTSWQTIFHALSRKPKFLLIFIVMFILIAATIFILTAGGQFQKKNVPASVKRISIQELPETTESAEAKADSQNLHMILSDRNAAEDAILSAFDELFARSEVITREESQAILQHPSHVLRLKIIKYLSHFKQSYSESLISSALSDFDPYIRIEAARALKTIESPNLRSRLEERLSVETDNEVKSELRKLLAE